MLSKIKVLMIGPDRLMHGGVSTVVNNYYSAEIEKRISLSYLPTVSDGSKLNKLWYAIKSLVIFLLIFKKFDIIHVHMAANASFVRKSLMIKMAYKKGIPILIQEHGGDFPRFYDRLDSFEQDSVKKIFLMANRIIVLSEEWKIYFGNEICDPQKVVVMHNGVLLPNKIVDNYKSQNILFLGRFFKEKGIYDLLDVIPDIVSLFPNAHFFLCGDGEIKKVKNRVRELGIEHNVSLPGWVVGDAKEEYYKKCSILILPSYFEAMPMVILEAMSYGEAVIATDVGGIPQIIDGNNGSLFKPGNLIELKNLLISFLSNSSLCASYGKQARKTIVDRFDLLKSVDYLYTQYAELLEEKLIKSNSKKAHISTLNLLKIMRKT